MAVRHFYDVISYQPDCSKIRLSIMCSSFCYFYTSLYLLSLYIYFLTCESHIKESTIKVYYKLYLFLLNSERQRHTEFSPQLISKKYNTVEILYIKQK